MTNIKNSSTKRIADSIVNLYEIILSPIVTEKSTYNQESLNKYFFKVLKSATKIDIVRSIEHIFNVKVENVRTIVMKPKKKVFKRIKGQRSAYKKAIITLKEGQVLDYSSVQ